MPAFDQVEVVVCVRDEKFERPLRQRFSLAMPEAHLKIEPGEPSAYADVLTVAGETQGTVKPLVKAQEVVGEFNDELRRRNECGEA